MPLTAHQQFFVKSIKKWNAVSNKRDMPWKGEKDPYKIWLSEIILQQTRVEQGLAYFHRFVAAFPTIGDLATAPEQKVFKLWEGLGYYTRCKNLLATARFINSELNGTFPNRYEDILALKGIGPYTAAAIGSFAFNLPHAVVDGNVFRVLARYFGNATPIDISAGTRLFADLANELLDKKLPGTYNQAMMDFGAVICKPQLPLCATCPVSTRCIAFSNNTMQQLPVKEKSITRKSRWFYYIIVNYREYVYVRLRGAKDIWENLHEFVLYEAPGPIENHTIPLMAAMGDQPFEFQFLSPTYRQLLTHQTIHGQFITVKTTTAPRLKGYQKVSKKALGQLAFPKFISNYLKDKNVSLNLF